LGSVHDGASTDVIAADVLDAGSPQLIFARADAPARLVAWSGTGWAPPSELSAAGADSIAASDLDGDGRTDLVFARADAADADEILLNTSTTTPAFFPAAELGRAPTIRLLTADFDDDGRADIAAINSAGG